jgi:hypothetical protein
MCKHAYASYTYVYMLMYMMPPTGCFCNYMKETISQAKCHKNDSSEHFRASEMVKPGAQINCMCNVSVVGKIDPSFLAICVTMHAAEHFGGKANLGLGGVVHLANTHYKMTKNNQLAIAILH